LAIKILFISHKFFPDVGGIETNSEILCSELFSTGYDVKLVTWSPQGDQDREKFPFQVIRNPSIVELIRLHSWAQLTFENNPCLRLAWPAVFFNRPSVIALNTWVTRTDGKVSTTDKIKRAWLKRASRVIAVSQALKIKSWRDAIVIHNPYRAIFREIPTIKRSRDIVFLGRLVSDKGADLALEALAELARRDTGDGGRLLLSVIGEGPERSNLEKRVKDLHLEDQVRFLGTLHGEKLVEELNRHSYLLVPSVWDEPFGNVVIEAMACGCLPIVSSGGGLPEAAGNAGLVFKKKDSSSLVAKLRELFASPQLEDELRRARQGHLKNHEQGVIAKKYMQVIESALLKTDLSI
jgi:glycosyltransferase involved in cell wall biosynthesis